MFVGLLQPKHAALFMKGFAKVAGPPSSRGPRNVVALERDREAVGARSYPQDIPDWIPFVCYRPETPVAEPFASPFAFAPGVARCRFGEP
ncbi:hypothetical protein AKJ09_08785 [Labilithrix luteola]|uniref:Uncharacterized protein n=1 Tax=Labilithrix luteola TaxID=1391654 RepID=A0A0K1Q8W8_9BACT|nr:hypothetical protein AKJ09_08785 [Labilithrix luteola]